MAKSKSKINFNNARKNITTTWLLLSGIIFLIFVFWTFSGKFGDRPSDFWSWLLPNIMPTLALIIGITVADINGKDSKGKFVSKFVYQLSMGLSIFYLSLILVIFISHGQINSPLFTILKNSSLFLGPLQGLVSAAIGAFFYKKE